MHFYTNRYNKTCKCTVKHNSFSCSMCVGVFVKTKLEVKSRVNSVYRINLVSMHGFCMIYTLKAFIQAVQVMCQASPRGSLKGTLQTTAGRLLTTVTHLRVLFPHIYSPPFSCHSWQSSNPHSIFVTFLVFCSSGLYWLCVYFCAFLRV